MRVDSAKLIKSMKQLPRRQRKLIGDVIRKSTLEGVRLARTMAPKDTGELAGWVHAKFYKDDHAFVGSIEAAPARRDPQVKALSVEFGRTYSSGKKRWGSAQIYQPTGTTAEVPYIRRTQEMIGKKHKARVRRAMNKVAKEVWGK